MYWLANRGGTPWAKLGGALPEEVVSRGAVRLPDADREVLVGAMLGPLGISPGAAEGCRPLELELLTARGAEEELGLLTWLEDEGNVWRLLLPSSLLIVTELVLSVDPDE